ncbi:MAG: YggT family protein [bacterium]
MLLIRLIDLYSLIVVAAVVVSWTNVPREHPAVRFLDRATEPLLGPIPEFAEERLLVHLRAGSFTLLGRDARRVQAGLSPTSRSLN